MAKVTLTFGKTEVVVTGSYLDPWHEYDAYFEWDTATVNGADIVPLVEALGVQTQFNQLVQEAAFADREEAPEPNDDDYNWII